MPLEPHSIRMHLELARKVREIQAELLVLEQQSVTFNGTVIRLLEYATHPYSANKIAKDIECQPPPPSAL